MKNTNKTKLLLALAAGLFLILGNIKTTLAAAPQATNLSASETYTEDTSLNLIDIVTSDADNDPLTATLTLSNPAAGSLTTGTSSSVTSTYNAGTGVWTASGAIASVNALLAGVTFVPATNFNSSFTITTSVTDGTTPVVGSKAMTGIAVNDAPTATNLSAAETYTEDTSLNLIDIVASDVDNATLTATLTISNPAAGSLTTGTSGSVTSTYNAGTGVWSASGATASVNTLLAGVTFVPTANFNGNFTIATSLSDGALSVTGSKAVTGTAVNDAPTATNMNAAETYTQDTALNLIDIVVSDVDSSTVVFNLVLSNPAAGSLTTGTSNTVTSTYNAGTGVWSASGAIADVNNLLAGVVFNPTAGFNGNFTITTSVSDSVAPALTGSKAMTGVSTNTSPSLDASKSPVLSTINEDSGAPSGAVGTLISSLVDFAVPSGQVDNVTDSDSGALLGVAITATDSANLTCYYSLNGGATWTPLGTVSNTSARLLAADSDNRIYCQPTPNNNGTFASAITFRAWDRTSGTDGSSATTASNGGSTAFSTATDTAALVVSAVNDAPVLDSSKSPILTSIAANSGVPTGAVGTTVSSLVDSVSPAGGLDNVTDVDSGFSLGVAIVGVDNTNLTCYYTTDGGASWALIGAVSDSNARLLAAGVDDRIYCQPASSYIGTVAAAITFRAWDTTSGVEGGLVSTAVNGGTTAFSTATDTAALTVNAINNAPVLDSSKSPTMGTVYQSAILPPSGSAGVLISSIVDFTTPAGGLDNVTDSDSSPLLGIAIIGEGGQIGGCVYSLDGGDTWTSLVPPSDDHALLLAADSDNRIYCAPFGNDTNTYNAFSFRAWDRTTGTDGGYADTSTGHNGGTTAFSSATDNVPLNITPFDASWFITTWKTDNTSTGSSTDHQITIPAFNSATYNVDWGDGSSDSGVTGPTTHTYSVKGTYRVIISDPFEFTGMAFGDSGDRLKLLEVQQWGTAQWATMAGAFFGASNMSITATDSPDLSDVTDMTYAFRGTTFSSGLLDNWDVSHVSTFLGTFQDAAFNGNIVDWDVSGATSFAAMFYGDTAFNIIIDSWTVSNATNFSQMFYGATSFNQSLGNWNINNATAMNEMLHGATLSTANYDATLDGWATHGFANHQGVHFDAGNSKFCSIDSWIHLVEAPNMWTVTDGGIGDCDLELTEVTPIPRNITSTSQAVYHFSANAEIDEAEAFHFGQYEVEENQCASCTVKVDPDAHTLYFENLRAGDRIDFHMSFVTLSDDVSNQLEVGPFLVSSALVGGGGGGGSSSSSSNPIPAVQSTISHPNGTLIINGQTIYLIKNGARYGFRDEAEYKSYGYKFDQAVQANSVDLSLPFDSKNILKAMPGTLVLDKADSRTVYMVGTGYTKRGFVSTKVFNALGYSFKNLPLINLSDYPTGPVIASSTEAHPDGSLILDGKTVWWVTGNTKQGFESQQVLDTYGFTSPRLVKANAADLLLTTGALVKLRDGTLVQDGGSYYIISDGKKLMFNGSSNATSLGYNLANFISATLQNYTAGNSL